MRPYRLKMAVAAWLGVMALGLNALVPIHLAFDIAHALAAGDPDDHSDDRDFVGCLLTLVVGHQEDENQSPPQKGHHHEGCGVSGSIGSLTGLAPVTATFLAVPILAYAANLGIVNL